MIETAPLDRATPATETVMPWGEGPGRRDIWPSAAQELLLRAALTPSERALTPWREIRSRIDIATLDGTTQALLPILRKNLLALGVEDELLALFKGVHRYSWARNQMLLAPMMPIVAALERAGLATLLLKGAAFVADRRLDAGMRSMNDVDVLVPSASLGDALEVLLENGLAPVGDVPPWYVAQYAPRFVPSHGFRDGLDRQLDLHWHVLHASCQEDADEDFWAGAESIELLGVATRALCPSDELLLVILHGLRWNALPTYRWVVDSALLCSGAIGEIDFERLVEQARKRRVTATLRVGLEYLRRVIEVPIPQAAIDALRAAHPSRLERMELAAQMIAPQRRSALQWEVIYHQQHARRELPLGARQSFMAHIGVARRRLGIERLGDLRQLARGTRPGPSRPDSEMAAAVGEGAAVTTLAPMQLGGEELNLGDPSRARACTAYGTWRAEGEGCWVAGREACLVLPLSAPAEGSLILELSADGFFPSGVERQRVGVSVNGVNAAELLVDPVHKLRDKPVRLPATAVVGREKLELVVRAPDAVSAARLGIAEDDRRIGVFLRTLRLRAPRAYTLGSDLELGDGSGDESSLLDGWGASEPEGRWTVAPLAEVLLEVKRSSGPLELEFDAVPFLAASRLQMEFEVLVNGNVAQSSTYRGDAPMGVVSRVPLAAGIATAGELLLGWRVRDPCSPLSLGISDDGRKLGLFIRRVRISER